MKHTFLTLALCCICTFLPAQSLLKDINKTGSSYPFALTPISEKEMLFFAEDSVHGVGLWKTNGTENGTQFIKTAPFQELIRFSPKIIKGKMYYLWGTYNGSNDHFVELHESDGTSEGTKVIWQSSLYPAYSSDDQYVNTNTHLFFALKNTQMQFLFSFDGTQVQLIDSFTTISHFQANEKKSYFYTSKNNVISVFESDGTKEGTKSIYEFPLLNSFYYPFYRLLKEELWLIQALSDSTITRINLNTREVTDIPTPKPRSIIHFQATNKGIIGSNSENIVAFEEQTGQFKTLFTVPDGLRIKLPVYGKNKMYFVTETPAHKIDLYVTDLNSFEIQLVAKIDTTNGSPIPEPISFPLTVINDIAYFRGPCNGVEWWQSDGTKEGTFCLKDIYEGESSGCFPLMEIDFVNNYLIFTATDASHGTELWKMLVPQPVPEGQGFLLYPNPASEMFSLTFAEQMKEREVRIYNTLGQEMARFMAEEKNVSFPTDALKEGLYYVSVNTPQLIETQKVIIIH